MKVLQINATVNKGSTGRIAEQIGEMVIKKRWKSFIAFARPSQSSSSNTIKIGTKQDFIFHLLQSRFFDKHGFASKRATNNLLKKIKRINPDLIHLHNLHGYYIHIGALFNFLNDINKPIVWTFHDCWPFTGHCAYFDRADCEKWKTACYSCPLKNYYPTSWVLDNSKSNFMNKKKLFSNHPNLTIVTPSRWLGQMVKQSFLKNKTVKLIHNGVDLAIFKPTKSSLREELSLGKAKVILGVANIWDDRKGLIDFLKLSEILNSQYQIVLVGLSKIQIKKLPANIIGIHRTENLEELVKLYSMADVYVNTTYSDNFPTTNIEALACGTPVITYDTGGSPEAIDENTGIVVKKGNVKGISDSIATILSNKDKFGLQNCEERAKELFNKNDRLNEYIVLYEKLSSLNKS